MSKKIQCPECENTRNVQVQCKDCRYSDTNCCTKYEVWCYDVPCPICRPKEFERATKVEKANAVKAILRNLGNLGVTSESFEGKLAMQILKRNNP